MHILHILNSYGGTEVYTQLIKSLDQLGVKQTVFVPLNPKNKDRIGNQLIDFNVHGSEIIYSDKLKRYHRYLYTSKISTIKREIEKHIDLKDISLIHAGLFCSDGAVAFELSKKYGLPFIVAVRNTDVNTYYKKMWWKRPYFHSILDNSKNIIFISHQYKKSMLAILQDKKINNLVDKTIVVPNGLGSYFLENRVKHVKRIHKPVKIVYAGAFNRGKNIIQAMHAM